MYQKPKIQFEYIKTKTDPVCKFNWLWISFNCFYNIKYGNEWRDIDKINRLKNETELKNIFLNLDWNIKTPFFNFINDRNNNWVKNIKDNVITRYSNMDCFSEFLGIIYTIRNNQFHWSKDWNNRNEIELLEKSSEIFWIFLEKLYESYK